MRYRLLDPRTTNSCDEPDLLVQEPTILKGTLSDDGTIDATGEVGGPYVTAASPLSVSTGDLVTVHGLSFDAAGGAAFVDGERAEVMSWGDREVRLRVPRVPSGARNLVLLNAASQSPAVTLQVTCLADCAGRVCGEDGCGGSCGTCAGLQQVCDQGTCVCEPDCQGKQCGTNGCGGSCGACGTDDACVAGQCVCVPQCEGKECGDNACGGLCGQCPIGQECTKIGLCAAP